MCGLGKTVAEGGEGGAVVKNVWLLEDAGKKSTLAMTAFAGESALVVVVPLCKGRDMPIGTPAVLLLVVCIVLAAVAWVWWKKQARLAREAAALVRQDEFTLPMHPPFAAVRYFPEAALIFAIQNALIAICLS